MKLCFDMDEELTKQEHKKSVIISFVLLTLIIIIETILMVILNRENIVVVLTIAIILFVIFSCFFSWFFFYKREMYKVYLKNIKKSQTELIEKEAKLTAVSDASFIKEHLEYYLLTFSLDKKQIDVEVLAKNIGDFIIDKTYKINYKGSVLYKYEQTDI